MRAYHCRPHSRLFALILSFSRPEKSPMSTHASSSRSFSNHAASDGRSGALAALLVLFLDLVWRVTQAPTGAQSIPESVVAAVARLTPTAVFGWATESFGSLAQNTLWAIVLVAVVGMGYWAGQIAGQLIRLGRFGTGVTGRFSAALIVAVVLFLIIAAGIFPLARQGFFAAGGGGLRTPPGGGGGFFSGVGSSLGGRGGGPA